MSGLLDSKANYEPCTVYLETTRYDADGNLITEPSTTGISAMGRFQPASMSGTSARRAEQDNEGFESEQMYTLRFPRSFPHVLGAQSEVEWRTDSLGRPIRWTIFGDPYYYNGSKRTAHVSYLLRRY